MLQDISADYADYADFISEGLGQYLLWPKIRVIGVISG